MKVVTKVTFTKKFEKQLDRLPDYLQQRVYTWIHMVESFGLGQVRRPNGLHDEPLQGNRWGQRSIRINRSYRVIYKTIENEVHIELIEVHKHDY